MMVEKISNRAKEVALFRSDTVNHLVTSHIYLMISLSGTKWEAIDRNIILIDNFSLSYKETKIEPSAISAPHWPTQAYLNFISAL